MHILRNRVSLRRNLWCQCFLMAVIGAVLQERSASAARAAEQVLQDREITLAIENALLNDVSVPTHLLDVQTKDGIATLSGSVDNLLAKERAAAVAQTIKGVRAVVNKVAVVPAARTDKQIRSDVMTALTRDPVTAAYEIDLMVKDGVVTLSGTVQSWHAKQLAAQIVKSVRGVKDVENDITFTYPATRPDAEITADIQSRLESDVWIDGGLIVVEVNDAQVTLHGAVGSAAEKHRAYGTAWVSGVQAVDDSRLEVTWWARNEMRRRSKHTAKSDQDIQHAVHAALTQDPRVVTFNPTVEVKNGVVTLTGVVNNLKAKHAAEQDAQNTVGVRRVKNYLKVRPSDAPSDTEIVQTIREALALDPYAYRYDIHLSVRNGQVTLHGNVDSTFDKERVEEITAGINGVVALNNYLIVNATWSHKDDEDIEEDIESELWWSPFVSREEITVSVQDGVATLTGTVDSWRERRIATEKAYAGGAKSVRNHLRLRGASAAQPS